MALTQQAPHRIGYRGQGYDAQGGIIGGRHAADYYVEASFPQRHYNPQTKECELPSPWPADSGLAEAREWAAGAMRRNPRVATIEICELTQRFQGSSWAVGGGVATIKREDVQL